MKPRGTFLPLRRGWPYAVLISACVLAFLPCLTFDILRSWDDQVYVLNNADGLRFSIENVRRWFGSTFFANYHPLTMLSYMVDYALWGLRGPGYHAQNLLWHTVAAIAVYHLALRLGLSVTAAVGAALVWGIHPLRVESVAWVAERKDVLCAALYCSGLCLAARDEQTGHTSVGPLVCFVLAFLAKSMAVSFPLALLCLSWHVHRRLHLRRWAREFWPYAVLLALMVPVTFSAQQAEHGVREGWQPLRQVVVAYWNAYRYILTTVLPIGLNPIYPMTTVDRTLALRLALCTAGAVVATVWLWRRQRQMLLTTLLPGCAAYICILAPVSGIIPLGGIDFADRYSYLPSVPLVLMGGVLVQAGVCRFGVARPAQVVALLAVCLGLTTHWSCFVWRDIDAVFGTACAVPEPNIVAVGAWGNCLIRNGKYAEALRIAEEGISRGSRSPKLRFLRARAMDKLGRKEEALALYRKLVPHCDGADFLAGIADCYRDLGFRSEAERYYSAVLDKEPANYHAFLHRGVVRFEQRDFQAAEQDLRAASELEPDRPEALLNLAQVLGATGREEEAVRLIGQIVRRFPEAEKMLR